jgi:hypothetical protein
MGYYALAWNTTGTDNTAVGAQAMQYNQTGYNNTAHGYQTLYNTDGSHDNVAIGYQALYSNAGGSQNTAVGSGALYHNTGSDNTAIGMNALPNNTTGYNNVACGFQCLLYNTDGWGNTANGLNTLLHNTHGINNTAFGQGALYYNTTGSNNIALGGVAGFNITTGTNNIHIGNQGYSSDNNVIRIGTVQSGTYLAGTVYANGVALTSDRNVKENFTAVNTREVLAKVAALPVTEWNYRTDSKAVQHIGPMAQDFQAAFGLAGTDDKHISVVDEGGVALAAIQGLNQKLNEKDAEIQELKQSIAELKALVEKRAGN